MEQRSNSLRANQGTGKTKVLTRDIDASLGKLPPQARDLEEAILGACLLESGAIKDVVEILRPEHFYTEANRIIYESIVALHREQKPVDMRTVVARLKVVGKLDLIGTNGVLVIADLASRVSSAANIEYHARVVVEHAMKRTLIEIASQIHHDAYDDGSDVFELLDKTEQVFKSIYNSSIVETAEAAVKRMWNDRMVTEEPAEPPPLLKIGDTPILIAGNHSLIVGKKKARKTLFIVQLLSEYLKGNPQDFEKVLLFDTEQGKGHVFKIRRKIEKMTGKQIPVFFLRGLTHVERVKFITSTIKIWHVKPKIVVIDGIRDLMADINDSDEANQLIHWLENTTLTHDLAVLNILHQNKTDKNPRGHIGTELSNKALATIELSLDEKSGHTIVKCESSRERGFDDFAFTHDGPGSDALPLVVGMPVAGNSVPVEERIATIKDIFENNETLSYKELLEGVKAHFKVGDNKAKQFITEFCKRGWLMKNGKSGKNTIYKILVAGNLIPMSQATGKSAELFADPPPPSPIDVPPTPQDLTLEDQINEESLDDLPF